MDSSLAQILSLNHYKTEHNDFKISNSFQEEPNSYILNGFGLDNVREAINYNQNYKPIQMNKSNSRPSDISQVNDFDQSSKTLQSPYNEQNTLNYYLASKSPKGILKNSNSKTKLRNINHAQTDKVNMKLKQFYSPYAKTILLNHKSSRAVSRHKNQRLDDKMGMKSQFMPDINQNKSSFNQENNENQSVKETMIKLPQNTIRINRKNIFNQDGDGSMSYLNQILAYQDQNVNLNEDLSRNSQFNNYETSLNLQNISSLDYLTNKSSAANSNKHSRSISRVELSINNYDKSLNEISRIPLKPPSWKQKLEQQVSSITADIDSSNFMSQVKLKPQAKFYNANQEFSDNVMHILDRSHLKYNLNIDDDFTIESSIAKKKIKTEMKLMKLMGPHKYQDYKTEQGKVQKSQRSKSNIGVYSIKKAQERNELFHKEIFDRAQSRRITNGHRIDQNEEDPEYQKVLENKSAKKYFLSAEEMKDDKTNKDDYFLPDIKDYHRIIDRGLERLKEQNYDDWSMLVKMCFNDPFKQQKNPFQVQVGSVELMRFHPFFNKLSYYAVKDFIQGCKLVKLRANQLLYRQEDPSQAVYIIMFGKIIVHHRILGALGVLGMINTVGEETLVEPRCSKKKDLYQSILTLHNINLIQIFIQKMQLMHKANVIYWNSIKRNGLKSKNY